jgi:ubiquinol-cytochrome c reductase cytochrome b subunit
MAELRRGLRQLLDYIFNRLERTVLFSLRFTFPRSYISPLGFLGMLTFSVFILLGITGAMLMLYYYPGITTSWDSVQFIEQQATLGYVVRNIHYAASNAMVLLAICHLYYQYFSGRFKVRNEMLWVTGVILGVLTVLEAFTGYNLIFNERAELAISIGVALAQSTPQIGPMLRFFVFGAGFYDFIIRFYTYHVFVIPVIMLLLMGLHFPRNLVFDVPMVSGVMGAIFIAAAIFPVELGTKFVPGSAVGFTVPEWYLSSLYAFLRTGMDKFVAGVLLPGLYILMFLVIPFIDKGKRLSWRDRPFFTGLGLASIAQAALTTVWGFWMNPATNIPLFKLYIPPLSLFGLMIVVGLACFGISYAAASRKRAQPPRPPQVTLVRMSPRWARANLMALVVFQIALNGLLLQAIGSNLGSVVLLELGVLLLSFSLLFHFYRIGA